MLLLAKFSEAFASNFVQIYRLTVGVANMQTVLMAAGLGKCLADSTAMNGLRMVSKLVGCRPEVLPIAFFHKCLQISGTFTNLRTTVVGWS